MEHHKESKVIKEEVIYSGRFLGMKYVDYTIGDKTVEKYEKVFRTTSKSDKVQGVDIVPIIKYKNKPAELLLIEEFRAPVKAYTLSFPTGMTEDDNYEQNARRELLEQTGYVINSFVKTPLPVVYYDPWKSDENAFIYMATIDGDDPNSFQGQKLQHDEDIRILKFPINDKLLENVVDHCKQKKIKLLSTVYTLCLGVWLRNNLGSL